MSVLHYTVPLKIRVWVAIFQMVFKMAHTQKSTVRGCQKRNKYIHTYICIPWNAAVVVPWLVTELGRRVIHLTQQQQTVRTEKRKKKTEIKAHSVIRHTSNSHRLLWDTPMAHTFTHKQKHNSCLSHREMLEARLLLYRVYVEVHSVCGLVWYL